MNRKISIRFKIIYVKFYTLLIHLNSRNCSTTRDKVKNETILFTKVRIPPPRFAAAYKRRLAARMPGFIRECCISLCAWSKLSP